MILIAGVTVWAVLIPESIAYASIAGVPAQYGLYTALGAAVGVRPLHAALAR